MKLVVPEFQNYKKKLLSILAKSLKKNHEQELFQTYISKILLTFRVDLFKGTPLSRRVIISQYIITGEHFFPGSTY